MNKQDLRKLKYHTIKNAYHDVKLAQRAREWSEERIYYELGITLPKNIPKLRKDVKEYTRKRLQSQLFKYQSTRDKLIKLGLQQKDAVKVASKAKKKSYNEINKVISRYKQKHTHGSDYQITYDPVELFFIEYAGYTKSERILQWSKWAKSSSDYPDEIIQAVEKINREKNLDPLHSLGWAVVYQGFLHNQDINVLKKYFNVDNFLPEMYLVSSRSLQHELA